MSTKTGQVRAVFVALVLLPPVLAGAGDSCKLTVRDATGGLVGRIDTNGTTRSVSGAVLGRLDDKTVRSASGGVLGKVEPNGTVHDKSGSTIGRVGNNGTLRSGSGGVLGRIEKDGKVYSATGSLAGRFDGYKPECRAEVAAFLFFFEPLHERQ